MDRLPTELLCLIFSCACTDGGLTGAALSTVSKRVRALSQRYALQTVTLHFCRNVTVFSALLEGRTPKKREVVHHLHMSDLRHPKCCFLPHQCDVCSSTHRTDHARTILAHVGLTLRTLTLHFDYNGQRPLIKSLTLSLPHLEELTISSYTFPVLQSTFPTLRKLHIVQTRDHPLPPSFCAHTSTLAPALRHLRLSRLSLSAPFLLGDLVRVGVASLVAASHDGREDAPGLPATLERLELHFCDEEVVDRLTPVSAYHRHILASVRWR